MTEPLRIGILGAARINDLSILEPARATGVRLVAVAARDRGRAEAYAQSNGIEHVADDYAAVIADPEVEAIYNPLPNSMHARWNLAAIRAGKHVLTEKPFASNAAEADAVRQAADASGLVVFEGFHYLYHPLFTRLLQMMSDGTIGQLTGFHVSMQMPAPEPDDLRWSWELSGGALMDMGCYCLHAIRQVALAQGGEPALVKAEAVLRAGLEQIDEQMTTAFRLPGGAEASGLASMNGPWDMSMTATGTHGTAHVPNFIQVHQDDRLVLTLADGAHVEHLGNTSTYTYQLRAFEAAVRAGQPYPTTSDDAVKTMDLIDQTYRAAGLQPRQGAVA